MKYVLFIVCAVWSAMTYGTGKLKQDGEVTNARFVEQLKFERQYVPSLNCSGFTEELGALCEKITEARKIATQTDLVFFKDSKGATRREFVLIVFDEDTLMFRKVFFSMGVNTKLPDVKLLRNKNDAEYSFFHLAGTSYNKMQFRVFVEEKELQVFAARWLRVGDAKSGSLSALNGSRDFFTYLWPPKHFDQIAFAERGLDFLLSHVKKATQALLQKHVSSRMEKGALVGDVVLPTYLVNLLVKEQTDPDDLYGKDWSPFAGTNIHPLLFEANRRVLINFFVNGLDAFRYVVSPADARGTCQFTKGTYKAMQTLYREADLDPSFERGSESFYNCVQASALLVDYELASLKLPDWVRAIMKVDKFFGYMFASVAYNAGPGNAASFAVFLKKVGDPFVFARNMEKFPWKELFMASHRKQGRVFPKETLGYVVKFWHNTQLFLPVPQASDWKRAE